MFISHQRSSRTKTQSIFAAFCLTMMVEQRARSAVLLSSMITKMVQSMLSTYTSPRLTTAETTLARISGIMSVSRQQRPKRKIEHRKHNTEL